MTNDVVFLQASQMSEEMSKELHLQAQEKLTQYLLRCSLDRKADQRREALLAQVNTDMELLMSMCLSLGAFFWSVHALHLSSYPAMAQEQQGRLLGTRAQIPNWLRVLYLEFTDQLSM